MLHNGATLLKSFALKTQGYVCKVFGITPRLFGICFSHCFDILQDVVFGEFLTFFFDHLLSQD